MKTALFLLAMLFGLQASAQSKKDTTYILYDGSWKVIEAGIPAFVGVLWKEGGKWHKQDIYYPSNKIQMNGFYADKDLKIQDGIFTWYDKNGMMTDSCLYVNNKRQGTQITWNKDGDQLSIQHWFQDLPVDTAVWWNKDGKITAVQLTDSAGNGRYLSYLNDGKTIRISGNIAAGKRDGKWIFRDGSGVLGAEAVYQSDSVISASCFNEKGEPTNGKNRCILEIPAAFKGGPEGWRRYLEKNLTYPESAQRKNIQGVVRLQFIIQKDGSVDEITVLDAPDDSLANEAKRLLQKSPKWEPAVQYNRPVIYRHIQSITFRLQ